GDMSGAHGALRGLARRCIQFIKRMGSFSSAPCVVNPDNQDDGVQVEVGRDRRATHEDVCRWCERQLAGTPARLLPRSMQPVQAMQALQAVQGDPDPTPARPQWRNDDSNTIRVLQWNVLSQALGTSNDNFVACPERALDWAVRRPLMLQELAAAAPDIICLQEVDHYKFLEAALSPLGYRGLWEPKPDSPCKYVPDNNGPDGCALMWRADKFSLVQEHRAPLHIWHMTSNQVVLLAVLRHEASGREVCVATTHLKARAGALMSTIRNQQGIDLLNVVAAHADGRPVLLAGDFNAEPSEPVYRTVLQHPALRLASAYSKASHRAQEDDGIVHGDPVAASAQGEPPYTTWKIREEGEQCHTIDYIFYSRSAFSVSALMDFPSGEALGPGRAPSYQYPSDHFSLCAELRLEDSRPEPRPPGRCASERTK
ncbi:Nocturnin, partial [Frankliniella fusca]